MAITGPKLRGSGQQYNPDTVGDSMWCQLFLNGGQWLGRDADSFSHING
jgi:hypothetical protein